MSIIEIMITMLNKRTIYRPRDCNDVIIRDDNQSMHAMRHCNKQQATGRHFQKSVAHGARSGTSVLCT